jgi:hypothetical protein
MPCRFRVRQAVPHADNLNCSAAYTSGVSMAVTAPVGQGFTGGLGTAYSTGAPHKLAKGAVVKGVTGLHVAVRHFGNPSVSSQIAALRALLLKPSDDETGKWFKEVVNVIVFFPYINCTSSNVAY